MHREEDSKFTEKDIPDLSGYVIIVTGGSSNSDLYFSIESNPHHR
jgi:ABC-type amino acid transport substrate-binding protein